MLFITNIFFGFCVDEIKSTINIRSNFLSSEAKICLSTVLRDLLVILAKDKEKYWTMSELKIVDIALQFTIMDK